MKQLVKSRRLFVGWIAIAFGLIGTIDYIHAQLPTPSQDPKQESAKPAAHQVSHSRDEIQKWCEQLGDRQFLIRESATKNLIDAGLDAVPNLCELMQSRQPEKVWRATSILVRIGTEQDEKNVAKMTRILHLLGTNGHPGLVVKAQQTRAVWKEHQTKRTIAHIRKMGGMVIEPGNQGQEMLVGGGGIIRLGGRIEVADSSNRRSGGNRKASQEKKIVSKTEPVSQKKLNELVGEILADNGTADAKALRKIESTKNMASADPKNGISNAVLIDSFADSRIPPSYGGGVSISLNRKWKGSEEDFESILDLPRIQSINIQDITVSKKMMNVIEKVSHNGLYQVQLMRCEFDSTQVRKFTRDHPNIYVNVRGKALLGVKGPIAGRATIVDPNSRNEGGKLCEITEVIANSSADKAGIKVGDDIKEVDGNSIKSFQDLVFEIAGRKIGDTVKLKIDRAGKEVMLDLKLGDSNDPNVAVDD